MDLYEIENQGRKADELRSQFEREQRVGRLESKPFTLDDVTKYFYQSLNHKRETLKSEIEKINEQTQRIKELRLELEDDL